MLNRYLVRLHCFMMLKTCLNRFENDRAGPTPIQLSTYPSVREFHVIWPTPILFLAAQDFRQPCRRGFSYGLNLA